MLEQVTERFDFAELSFRFAFRLQPSVINFARRSKTPIHYILTAFFSPDPHEILELPWAQSLCVKDMTPGFSDQQVLELAKQGHPELEIPANLSHPATLQRLIEIVHSTSLRRVAITVDIDYYHRFLSSIALVEEGRRLMDVSDPRSPIIWIEMEPDYPDYILDTGTGYLFVGGDHLKRTVHIYTDKCHFLACYPMHSMSLSRVCPNY
ncbi:hypothetical protein PFISCL1PPCAC_3523, partial [Pristionchus fissidentatus]